MSLENNIDLKTDFIITDVDPKSKEATPRSSVKIQILKRSAILLVFFTFFLASCIGHYSVENTIQSEINNSTNSIKM